MSTTLGHQANHYATLVVATVTKCLATITSAVSYALNYAVCITIVISYALIYAVCITIAVSYIAVSYTVEIIKEFAKIASYVSYILICAVCIIIIAVGYTLICAVCIPIAILIQNSAYYLTALAVRLSEELGPFNCMQYQRIHNLYGKEEVFRATMNTIIAVQLSVLITLALWAGARFCVGITVKMSAVKFGWHDLDGGQDKLALKQEHDECTGTPR
ncbi:MAG: hypothetical protein Q9172_004003 [Xanthocarpia lactea]